MSFDATKSTKGASKLRRDLINAEIANLRDLLPLPSSTRQRLSQLQLMALVCVYVRKANYFQQVFRKQESGTSSTPNFGFSKALSGFLMMSTQNGKLLYISDNAAEYLGHSMEDLLIHGDSVYDIIDKQDHQAVQAELLRTPTSPADEERLFLCRMNVSRNARRQMRFGDQKVVLMQGHFLSFLPLCSRNEPVFLATCTPVAMPETRECVVQGATHVFTSIHSMDMKFLHIDKNGEFYLGYSKSSLQGVSWYQLVHWEHMREAQAKHRLITQSEQDRSGILLLRLITHSGSVLWVHAVLQVKDNMDNSQQPVVVCTNQILTEKEAAVMRANSWLYHYYSVQSKLQYGLTFEPHAARMPPYYPSVMSYGMTSGPSEPPSMQPPYLSPSQPGTSSQNGSQHVSPTMPPPPHPYGFPLPGTYHHLPTGPVTEPRSLKRRTVFLGTELGDHHGSPCCPELLSTVAYGCVSGVLTTPLPLPAGPKLKGRKLVASIPEEDEPWTAASPPWLNEGGSQTVPDVLGGWSPHIRPSIERRINREDSDGTSTHEQHVPDVLTHRRNHSRVKLENVTFTDGMSMRQNVDISPTMHHYHPYRLLRPTKFEDIRSDSPPRMGSSAEMINLNTPSSSTPSLRSLSNSSSNNSVSSCSNGSWSEPESPGWCSPAAWPFHMASRECSRCAAWAIANPQFTARFTFDTASEELKRESFHSADFPPTPSASPQSPIEEHTLRRHVNSRPSWPPPNASNPSSQVMGQMPSCINSPTPCQDAFW